MPRRPRRYRLVHSNDPRFVGLTGTVGYDREVSGWVLWMEHPYPACTQDYEDTRGGKLRLSDDGDVQEVYGNLERISWNEPKHGGVGDGPCPMVGMLIESIADTLNEHGATELSWSDDNGTVTSIIDLTDTRRPHQYKASYGAYLNGTRHRPLRKNYGLNFATAEAIRSKLKEAHQFAQSMDEAFDPQTVSLPEKD